MFVAVGLLEEICCSDYTSNTVISKSGAQWREALPLFKPSFKADSSVVDYDTNQYKRTQERQKEKEEVKRGFGTVINRGKAETVVTRSEKPSADEMRKLKEMRARRFDFTLNKPEPAASKNVPEAPLNVVSSVSVTSGKSKLLEEHEKAEQKRMAQKATVKENKYNKSEQTLQASYDAQEYKKNKPVNSPAVFSFSDNGNSFFNDSSPLEENYKLKAARANLFKKLKNYLKQHLDLSLRGGLFDKPPLTANGLVEAILAHYEGYDKREEVYSQLQLINNDINNLSQREIIEKMASIFSITWKNIFIVSCHLQKEQCTFYIDDSYCDVEKLSLSLDKPFVGDDPIFILNYPNDQGDQYYCIVNENKQHRLLNNILKAMHYSPQKRTSVSAGPAHVAINNWPFTITTTEAKGDCFFIAIANQIGLDVPTLRQATVDKIRENQGKYIPFLDEVLTLRTPPCFITKIH